MNTWFTSDLHLGHASVIKFCNRPFQDVIEMDNHLIRTWNKMVKPDDYVYVLGDVSFYAPSVGVSLIRLLAGRKILIKGNHDKYSLTQYRMCFDAVLEEAKIKLEGHYFQLSHFPYAPSLEEQATMEPHYLRYLDRRPVDRGSWLLCGHIHEKWKTHKRMINVGVDVWNYQPVSTSQILKLLAVPSP